jgi:hypothetical protein
VREEGAAGKCVLVLVKEICAEFDGSTLTYDACQRESMTDICLGL